MPEARCPKCGYHCYGWALTNPEHQICPKCGTRLQISQANSQAKEPDSRGFKGEKGIINKECESPIPRLSGDLRTDAALWRLSQILKEIVAERHNKNTTVVNNPKMPRLPNDKKGGNN